MFDDKGDPHSWDDKAGQALGGGFVLVVLFLIVAGIAKLCGAW